MPFRIDYWVDKNVFMACLFFRTWTLSVPKTRSHSSSHNWPTEIKVELFKSGKMWADWACRVRSGDKGRTDFSVDLICFVSGSGNKGLR